MRQVLLLSLFGVLVVGCSGSAPAAVQPGGPTSTAAPTSHPASTLQGTPIGATLVPATSATASVGAVAAPTTGISEAAILAGLKASGLPVVDPHAYTAENDPNKLLGRPGQYVVKVNWTDSRAAAAGDAGTIEVFTDGVTMRARAQFIEELGKSTPLLLQYVYPEPRLLALLRLPHDLTPAQAGEYQTWLKQLQP